MSIDKGNKEDGRGSSVVPFHDRPVRISDDLIVNDDHQPDLINAVVPKLDSFKPDDDHEDAAVFSRRSALARPLDDQRNLN